MNNKSFINQKGFTLIELIVVVVVLGIIVAIGFPILRRAIARSNEASAIQSIRIVAQSETSYFSVSGSYATLQQLKDSGSIDGSLGEFLTSATEATKTGYNFSLNNMGNEYVLSAIPASRGLMASGFMRFGVGSNGQMFQDKNNLETHYTTIADLTAGTSTSYEVP